MLIELWYEWTSKWDSFGIYVPRSTSLVDHATTDITMTVHKKKVTELHGNENSVFPKHCVDIAIFHMLAPLKRLFLHPALCMQCFWYNALGDALYQTTDLHIALSQAECFSLFISVSACVCIPRCNETNTPRQNVLPIHFCI